MASKNQPPPQPQKPALNSAYPIAGRPWQRRFPTPNIDDYIVSVRRDTRVSGFVMPKKGDVFDGVDQRERLSKGFKFATSVAVEQLPGFVDLYYLAPFKNQEEYNYTVEYPYVDRNFPRFTRTYIVLRTDDSILKEPQADTYDPVFGKPFQLTDHKIERITDDNVLDALFIRVLRVYEKLPGPVITTFENNNYQQLVAIATQEVQKGAPLPQSALTEIMKQERTGTAKAKNTLGKVDKVFPAEMRMVEIPAMTRELYLAGFQESTDEQIQAGLIDQPPVLPGGTAGLFSVTQKQLTLYKKQVTVKALPLPQTRHHKEITERFGGGVIKEDIFIDDETSSLDILDSDDQYLVLEVRLRVLPGFGKIKMIKYLDEALWPPLSETKTDPQTGIRIDIVKQVLPTATPIDEPPPAIFIPQGNWRDGYVDIEALDRWRRIHISSKVDPSSLPPPIEWGGVHRVSIPPTLVSITPVWEHFGGPAAQATDNDFATASATYRSGVKGAPRIQLRDGFDGEARARFREVYTLGPPTPSQIGTVLKIAKSYGTVTFIGSHTEFNSNRGGDQGTGAATAGGSNQGQVITDVHPIQGVLCAGFNYVVEEPIPLGAQSATAHDFSGGVYSVTAGSALTTGKMFVDIPASSPTAYPTSEYLADAVVERWRLGVFVTRYIFVTLP